MGTGNQKKIRCTVHYQIKKLHRRQNDAKDNAKGITQLVSSSLELYCYPILVLWQITK